MKKNREIITPDPRIAYFDRHASGWDEDAGKIAWTLARLEASRALLCLRATDAVLEVGCGTGQITSWLCSAVAAGRVVAIDFSAEMLARARAKGIPAEFRRLDICAEAPGDSCFDVALCFHSFPHFRDQAAALGNLRECLRPGGRLIVMHLAGSEQINARHAAFGGAVADDRLPPAGEWEGMLARAGMDLVRRIDGDDLSFLEARARG